MRVKSGFKEKRKRNRSSKIVFLAVKKRLKKMLSFNLFTISFINRLRPQKQRLDPRRYLKKDVKQKTFNNPYRVGGKRKQNFRNILENKRYIIAQIALVFILITWIFVLFVQPTFYLVAIRVEGTKEINADDIVRIIHDHMKSRSRLLIKHAHLFFLDENELESMIRQRYGLDTIEFTTHWPSHSLLVQLTEKSSILGYSINDAYYTIDRLGTIIREVNAAEFTSQSEDNRYPIIYEYDASQTPEIGSQVLSEENIKTILTLYEELKKYPSFDIHSFRLKQARKGEIKIPEKFPEIPREQDSENDLESSLDDLADSIAHAQTIDEKIANIKQTLEDIDIEKIEEGSIDKYLETEKRFTPNDSIQFQELEIYTNQGWTLKLGAEVLLDDQEVEKLLDIFATLSREVDIEREVKDYIDLRFSNRIYYR